MAAYLIDTHVLIWIDSSPENLSPRAIAIIENPSNDIWISTVSLWEMQIKRQLGKLSLAIPIAEIVSVQIKQNHFQLLDICLPHVLNLDNLPLHHKDPFDRMLISQAMFGKMAFISQDPFAKNYPIEVIW